MGSHTIEYRRGQLLLSPTAATWLRETGKRPEQVLRERRKVGHLANVRCHSRVERTPSTSLGFSNIDVNFVKIIRAAVADLHRRGCSRGCYIQTVRGWDWGQEFSINRYGSRCISRRHMWPPLLQLISRGHLLNGIVQLTISIGALQ